MTDNEIKENLLLLANALVSIVEFECCDYGFDEAVDLAYLIIEAEAKKIQKVEGSDYGKN